MRKTDVEKIDFLIAEVFRLTGTRLTADDPIVAVLLMQEQSFQTAFAEFAERQNVLHEAFLKQIAKHEQNITAAAAKLEGYREQLLVELSQHAGGQIEEATPRIHAAVSQRIMSEVGASNTLLVSRLTKLLAVAFGIAIVLMIVFVFYVT